MNISKESLLTTWSALTEKYLHNSKALKRIIQDCEFQSFNDRNFFNKNLADSIKCSQEDFVGSLDAVDVRIYSSAFSSVDVIIDNRAFNFLAFSLVK